jgi:predicted nucleotidyltransferase
MVYGRILSHEGKEHDGMTVQEETLQQIINKIVELANPDRVILFGSAATGEMTADSDLDLLVVESRVSNTRRESIRLRAALEDVPFPIDVIVMSRQRFDDTKNVVGGIAYPAHKYGRVLYEAA